MLTAKSILRATAVLTSVSLASLYIAQQSGLVMSSPPPTSADKDRALMYSSKSRAPLIQSPDPTPSTAPANSTLASNTPATAPAPPGFKRVFISTSKSFVVDSNFTQGIWVTFPNETSSNTPPASQPDPQRSMVPSSKFDVIGSTFFEGVIQYLQPDGTLSPAQPPATQPDPANSTKTMIWGSKSATIDPKFLSDVIFYLQPDGTFSPAQPPATQPTPAATTRPATPPVSHSIAPETIRAAAALAAQRQERVMMGTSKSMVVNPTFIEDAIEVLNAGGAVAPGIDITKLPSRPTASTPATQPQK